VAFPWGPLTPCTRLEDVHVICLFHWRARARLDTGGGWRRTCVRRERRWPSFIIWRWAGPALAGWIRCRWRVPPLRLPPRDLHRSATSMSPRRPVPAPLNPRESAPRRAQRGSRPRGPGDEPRNRLRRAPKRQPEGAPGRRRGRPPVNRPGRAPERPQSGAGRPRGSGQRRADADAS